MKVLSITARSASFTTECNSAYYAPAPFDVLLNGETAVKEEEKNVFSLFNLTPDTEYILEARGEKLSFKTACETSFLSVKDFGAAGDGLRDDTPSFSAAVACAGEGSTIYVPAGDYRIKPVFLKSGITLWLDKGARLVGETDRTKYPVLPAVAGEGKSRRNFGTWQGEEANCFASMLTAIGCRDVAVIGEGVIDGNAQNSDWYVNHRVMRIAWRPRGVFFNRCENVLMQGVTVRDTPSWNVHPYFCKNVKLYNLSLYNIPSMPTTDGIDPDCCEGVDIAGVNISVGDDCIAIKSGTLELARRYKTPCRDIKITDCLMECGHGGVVFGSESSGGIENVHVERCIFRGTERGFRIKTRRGRGRVGEISGVVFKNIVMQDVITPFVINMYYNMGDQTGHTEYAWTTEKLPVDELTPLVGDFEFSDMKCTGVCCCAGAFYGLPEEPIKRIKLKNVSFEFNRDCQPSFHDMKEKNEAVKCGGLYFLFTDKVELENVTFSGVEGEEVVCEGVGSVHRK